MVKHLGLLLFLGLLPSSFFAAEGVFAKRNLVAWCIVPSDAAQRGPAERAKMLKRLGITQIAYDYQAVHIPTLEQELHALKRERINLRAVWMLSGPQPENTKRVTAILDFLQRHRVRTQLWYLFLPPTGFASLSQREKVETASRAVLYIAEAARKIHCPVALYNHGDWYGEPENQLAILARVKMPNVGMVYNFHHGREQVDRFPEFYPKILPHLMALNLNGMKKDGPLIVTLGEGDFELEMLKIVRASSYRGPIGILHHQTGLDAEVGLSRNIEGLKRMLARMGDEAALKTY